MKLKFSFVLIILLLLSCEPVKYDLGGYLWFPCFEDMDNNSIIVVNKGEIVYAGDTKEKIKKKGTLIIFFNEFNKTDSMYIGKESEVIEPYIVDVSFDKTFIIVDQKSLDTIFGVEQDRGDSGLGRRIIPRSHDIDTSTFHQYFIIIKSKDYVYGPFRKEVYFRKKKELGVPDSLKLKFEKDLK